MWATSVGGGVAEKYLSIAGVGRELKNLSIELILLEEVLHSPPPGTALKGPGICQRPIGIADKHHVSF